MKSTENSFSNLAEYMRLVSEYNHITRGDRQWTPQKDPAKLKNPRLKELAQKIKDVQAEGMRQLLGEDDDKPRSRYG